MDLQFTFRHMNSSPELRNYVTERLRDRVKRIDPHAIGAHVSFEIDDHNQKIVHCSIHGGDGANYFAEQVSIDGMQNAIDQVVDKIVMQLQRHKARYQHHQRAPMHATPRSNERPN